MRAMNENANDEIAAESVLDGRQTTPPDPALRQRLWELTSRQVRRRRWRIRARQFGLLLAVYAAGWGTSRFVWSPPIETIVVEPAPALAAAPIVSDASTPVEPVATTQPAVEFGAAQANEPTANELEVRAAFADTAAERAELFRQAGDRYVRENGGNLRTALECYRNALDAAPRDEAESVSVNDHWLLAALKEARRKEREHDTQTN